MVRNLDGEKLIKADKHITHDEKTLVSDTADFGAWVELIPSISIFGNYISVQLHDPNTVNDYRVEIGKGPSGSEETLIPGIVYHVDLVGNSIISIPFEFKIEEPRGTRISARCESITNTDEIHINTVISGT